MLQMFLYNRECFISETFPLPVRDLRSSEEVVKGNLKSLSTVTLLLFYTYACSFTPLVVYDLSIWLFKIIIVLWKHNETVIYLKGHYSTSIFIEYVPKVTLNCVGKSSLKKLLIKYAGNVLHIFPMLTNLWKMEKKYIFECMYFLF